ncbi:3-deoxy-D-manno-octulosonic acid transferase [Phenylobacterium deserti]|uniref:3-deoxy-D-manno-octulosonic acid transferase n=1 Tax=Phenylobacterium deserti TaxID=1914756 RepID=A0A328AVU3_9CAUL|nr:3-deoxy-D-manno-octulosonic acid transferase [Phenylobacterium deserti]
MRTVRPLPLALYGIATGLLEPLAPRVLRARAAKGKEDPARLRERLGRATRDRPQGPLVWLHGVSVGESLSLLPLIEALRTRRPELNLLVTSGTVTSAEMMARRLPAGVIHQFAPVDTPGAVHRFLDHWRPDAGLQVESELWPNMVLEAARRGVRLALISARITEKSAAGWARTPSAAHALLSCFDLILPQDAETEERLQRLGGQIGPRLNLKLVGVAPPVDAALVAELEKGLAGRRAVLAASTHPGEEPLIARAFRAADAPAAVLIVAPRHPERGPGVAEELTELGFTVGRRGAGQPLTPKTTAYVVDTLGELGAFYATADAVVMGGSFVDGVGGHNPMEPARLSAPMITGPHVFNARAMYDDLLAEAGVIEAADGEALARHIGGLLAYPHIARRVGEAAFTYAERQGAALKSAMTLIHPLLPA